MIKKLLLVVALTVYGFSMDYNLKPVQISKSVWQFLGKNEIITKENGGNMVNTYWLITPNHWVVIDTGPTYLYAQQAHNIMKKISDLPIKMVINTHKHDDHWMGNSYYKELGIDIYATKLQDEEDDTKDTNRIFNILNKKDQFKTELVKIDKFITKNKVMNIDGVELEFILLEKTAHTKEDILVYMKNEEVLFCSDLLFSERITSIRDGSIEGSLESLDIIEEINPKVYANGHGKYTDKTALNDMRKYLTLLKTSALEAIEEDIDMSDYIKTTNFEEFKNHKLYDTLNKDNLGYAYREYEFYD